MAVESEEYLDIVCMAIFQEVYLRLNVVYGIFEVTSEDGWQNGEA